MKKLLSICLTVVMMVCLLAGISVNATDVVAGDATISTMSTPSYEYYYLGSSNILTPVEKGAKAFTSTQISFGGPSSVDRLFAVGGTTGNVTSSNYIHYSGLYGYGAVIGDNGASATMELYVDTPGAYKIWAYVPYVNAPRYSMYTTGVTPTYITSGWEISVNDGAAQQVANENYNATTNKDTSTYPGFDLYSNQFYWDSITVDLNAGRNTIKLASTVNNSYIISLFVTNDTSLTSDKFMYVGYNHIYSEVKQNGNSHKAKIVTYFGDGVWHDTDDREGFINLVDYSDRSLPTITSLTGSATNDSITVTWTEDDPTREYAPSTPHHPVFMERDGTETSHTDTINSGYAIKYSDASGVHHADIYQDGVLVATVPGGTQSYTATGLDEGSAYNFEVKVVDHFGYEKSATAPLNTTGEPDTTDPTWPENAALDVAYASFSATVTWPTANDDRSILGYSIYEGSVAPENLIDSVTNNVNSYEVPLNPGDVKDIYVVASDRANNTTAALDTTVTSQLGSENFTLREGNFDVANGFSLLNISSTMMGLGCTPLNLGTRTNQATNGQALRAAGRGGTTTAEIYVDTPGDYVLFARVQSGYKIKASVGGGAFSGYLGNIPVLDASNNKLYVWAKADRVWTLEAGWNTVKLEAEDAAIVPVVFVTNSINMEPDEITYAKADSTVVVDGKLNIGCYEDTELPIYAAGDLTVAYDTTINEATITWPAATDMDYTRPSPEYTMPASGLQSYKVYVDNKEIAELDNATTSFVINETTLGRALVPGETLSIKVDAIDMYGNASPKALSYEVSKLVISNFAVEGNTATLTIKNVSEASADIRLSIAIYDDATGNLVAGDYVVETIANDGVDATVTASITSGAPADMTGYTLKAHLWNADLSPVSANWPTIVQ